MSQNLTNLPQNPSPNNPFANYRWLIVLVVFITVVYFLLPVLTPFLVAAILAYMCDPLVDRLSDLHIAKYKFGRTPATLLVMTGIFAILTLLVLIIVPLLQKESGLIAERLPSTIGNIRATLEPWLQHNFGISLNIDAAQIQEVVTKNWKTAGGLLTDVLKTAGSQGLALIGVLANILLLPVVLFYMLRDWDGFVASISQLIPRDWLDTSKTMAIEIDQVLAEFLRGQLTVMLIMSAFYAAGLWLIGLDSALSIGLIAGLLGFVPYLGPALGMGLALLVAALQFTSLSQIVPVLMVFGAGQLIESNVITPKLVGDRIGLHPVVVIFALLAGGQLFGFVGILLALPVSAAIAVALRHTKQSYLNSDTYLK
jgi:predicted PurR-regulated permease PerM